MIVIGVASEKPTVKNLIKRVFSENGSRVCTLDCAQATPYELDSLSRSGIDCAVITLNRGEACGVYIDVLILENIADITYELVKCVYSETRLVYNADSTSSAVFDHPNAISYGMTYTADATVSSVDDKYDGISFVFCLQRPVITIGGRSLYEGEIQVMMTDIKSGINEILAAVTCGIICDLPIGQSVKS